MAENFPWGESCTKYASYFSELDIPINSMLIDHDPDGRTLDSEMLLRVIETIMLHTSESQGPHEFLDLDYTEEFGPEFTMSLHIITSEIISKCIRKESSHAITLDVLSLLGSYTWDGKLLLTLSAFATHYGQFRVIMQSKNRNSLAASIALLKQFPRNLNVVKPVFTALTKLVSTMLGVTESAIRFEALPTAEVEHQAEVVATTKKVIYRATYWVVRSITQCFSLVVNLRAVGDDKHEQVHSFSFRDQYSVSNAIWELTSLKSKISSISAQLREQVDVCQTQTEEEMQKKISNLFYETHVDNQEVLRILFTLKDYFPLKQSSEHAQAISSLKDKVVILLISKPELLPIEELLLLVQQTHDHQFHSDKDGSYAILWIPVSESEKWSNHEITMFKVLSNSLPWYSIRQPWSLSSTTIKYVKEEWNFIDKPIMVVLDSQGNVTNLNANDMVWTWGVKAYPFSTSREKELWEEETWSMKLLLDDIDYFTTMWVEQRRTICIYGSSKLDWIRDFIANIRDIQSLYPELEVVYVGNNGQNEVQSNITCVVEKERLSKCLSLTKMKLFWHRLESMKRSKLSLGSNTDTDHILKEIEALLTISSCSDNNEWIVVGRGCSTKMVTLHGDQWTKFMSRSLSWKNKLSQIGLVNAIRLSLEPPAAEPCAHPRFMKYNEGMMEETLVCEKCKHLIKKSVVYDAGEVNDAMTSNKSDNSRDTKRNSVF